MRLSAGACRSRATTRLRTSGSSSCQAMRATSSWPKSFQAWLGVATARGKSSASKTIRLHCRAGMGGV